MNCQNAIKSKEKQPPKSWMRSKGKKFFIVSSMVMKTGCTTKIQIVGKPWTADNFDCKAQNPLKEGLILYMMGPAWQTALRAFPTQQSSHCQLLPKAASAVAQSIRNKGIGMGEPPRQIDFPQWQRKVSRRKTGQPHARRVQWKVLSNRSLSLHRIVTSRKVARRKTDQRHARKVPMGDLKNCATPTFGQTNGSFSYNDLQTFLRAFQCRKIYNREGIHQRRRSQKRVATIGHRKPHEETGRAPRSGGVDIPCQEHRSY